MQLLGLGLLLHLQTAYSALANSNDGGSPSWWSMDACLMSPSHRTHLSPTAREQAATERAVWDRYQQQQQQQQQHSNATDDSGLPPFRLLTARHVRLLVGVLESFSEGVPAAYAASVPWCCYWCCHALDVVGAADPSTLGPALRARILQTLQRCQQPDGGFSGLLSSYSPPPSSHVLSTYAALATVAILHRPTSGSAASPPPPIDWLSRRKLCAFLRSLKHPTDGTFRATPAPDAETDARSVYSALAVARLAGLLGDPEAGEAPPLIEREKLVEYLLSLQTHEGGFSGEPGDDEAHAGFSYCALASLRLLGAVDRIRDPGGLLLWAARRQRPFEGGLDGRTNKLVDACYSFWAGALPPLLLADQGGREKAAGRRLLHATALARYLLAVSQSERGGFADKPGAAPDYYHTCYALSGLAVAVHEFDSDGGLAWLRHRVGRVDLALNLVCETTLAAWDASSPLSD